MKRCVIGLIIALTASPALAAKISWADPGCGQGLVDLGNGEYEFLHSRSSGESMLCDGPASPSFVRDVTLDCEGGYPVNVHVVDNDRLIFGDTLLFRVTEDGPICD